MNFAWNFTSVLAMDAQVRAAGIAFQAPDGTMLFLKRSDNGDHAGEWCFPGGGIEGEETPEQAARREVIEETGNEMFLEAGPLKLLSQIESDEGVDFTTFIQPIVEQFTPVLNNEHDEFVWASNPPSPLHPGVAASLAQFAMDAEDIRDDRFVYSEDGDLEIVHVGSKEAPLPTSGEEEIEATDDDSSVVTLNLYPDDKEV